MRQPLQIQLFGGFHIQGETPIAVKSERLRALLTHLLLHRGIPQMRQTLAFRFWPESSDTQARTNLRRELHTLRHSLSELEPCLQITHKTLSWREDAPCQVDLFEFEAAIARAEAADKNNDSSTVQTNLQQAVRLYQGELYPHCYDDWILSDRGRLQEAYNRVLSWLVQLFKDQQDYRNAVLYGQQLLRLDPLNEAAYLNLMKLFGLQGDRAGGLRIYHRCMERLREELGVDPSPELRAVYEQLLMEEPPPEKPSENGSDRALPTQTAEANDTAVSLSETDPQVDWGEAIAIDQFYGRTAEQATVSQWITADRCRLVALLGQGGIGKTALAVKLCHHLLEPSQDSIEKLIWRSLWQAPPLEVLLSELLAFLTGEPAPKARPEQLLTVLRRSRCVIVLDGIEALLQPDSPGQYQAGYENYGDLLRLLGETTHQSCVLLTSREKTAEIAVLEGTALAVRSLTLEGSPEAAIAILAAKGLAGSTQQREALSQFYGHNPLALKMVATSIQDLFDGNIAALLEQDSLLFKGVNRLYEQQCQRCSSLEHRILVWIALQDKPTSVGELAHHLFPPVARGELLEAIEALRWRSLIHKQGDTSSSKTDPSPASPSPASQPSGYQQQPVLRAHLRTKLLQQASEELWQLGKAGSNAAAPASSRPKAVVLQQFALLNAEAPAERREQQRKAILIPLLQQLQGRCHDRDRLWQLLQQALQQARQQYAGQPGYLGGNLLNLLSIQMLHQQESSDLQDLNFSGLCLWQADFSEIQLVRCNLVRTDLSRCRWPSGSNPRSWTQTNLWQATGLSPEQREHLLSLGAIERARVAGTTMT